MDYLMKKKKLVAAILFGILAVVQAYALGYAFNVELAKLPFYFSIELAAFVFYIYACVRFLKTADVAVTGGEKRAAAALGVIYLVITAINLKVVTNILSLAFIFISQEFAMNPMSGIAFLIVRTALIFAALCFTLFNEKAPAEKMEPNNIETIEDEVLITSADTEN